MVQVKLENKKIGILGGTFDPAHKGHLKISRVAIKKYKLAKIIWAITKKNPFKKESLKNYKERISFAKMLINKKDLIQIKCFENDIKSSKTTQSQDKNMDISGLTLSEEDALKAQIFGCWSIPLGLPYNENLLVRIKLRLKPDGSVTKTEIIDHARMNKPGQGFYKVLAESALRAIRLCKPLRVPTTGYERWKDLQLNFDAREMLEG